MRHDFKCGLYMALLLFVNSAASSQSVGWRGSGTGVFDKTQIVTVWECVKDQRSNVLWYTPFKNWSNASPCIVNDRIFICGEPYLLYCLQQNDGKLLWERSHDYDQIMTEEEKALFPIVRKSQDEFETKLRTFDSQIAVLRKDLNDPAKKEMAEASIARLMAEKDELHKSWKPDPLIARYERPQTHNETGYSTATPSSDGRYVAAIFGNGLAAVYDMEGKRQWIKSIGKIGGRGLSASPLIHGDKVIFLLGQLLAFELATGKPLWQVKSRDRHGSPIVANAGAQPLLIAPNGEVVALETGKLVAQGLPGLTYNAPTVSDITVYIFNENIAQAYVLPERFEGDTVANLKPLWSTEVQKERYYASPVYFQEIVYGVTQNGILTAIEAKTGAKIYEQNLGLSGRCYSSLTICGDKLLIGSDSGIMLVCETGRTFKEIARNKLERFRSTPIAAGNRLYLRMNTGLACFGKSD